MVSQERPYTEDIATIIISLEMQTLFKNNVIVCMS